MAWASASNALGAVSFYLQDDTGWIYEPEHVQHTPIGAVGSDVHWIRSASPQRTVVGYILAAADRVILDGWASSGSATVFNGENCYVVSLAGRRVAAENISYLELITARLVKDD